MQNLPRHIFDSLKDYVKGQDDALKKIATAVSIHIKNHDCTDDFAPKSNILVIGDTGCGKTETVRALEEMELTVPVVLVSALDYSVSAWQGRDISEIFVDAYRDAVDIVNDMYGTGLPEWKHQEKVVDTVEHSIIVIDEFDKISRNASGKKDEFKADYQHALLTIIEGKRIPLKVNDRRFYINTTGMMFILMGAFAGLSDITRKRVSPPAMIGFDTSSRSSGREAELMPNTEDLLEFGMPRELIGRIPLRVKYNKLTVDEIVDIMRNAQNSPLQRIIDRASTLRCVLDVTDDAVRLIAEQVISLGTGVRGVEVILTDLLYNTLFDAADGRLCIITVDKDSVLGVSSPVVYYDGRKKTK